MSEWDPWKYYQELEAQEQEQEPPAPVAPPPSPPPIGLKEEFSRMDVREKLPFVGAAVSGLKTHELKKSVDRLKADNYSDNFQREFDKLIVEDAISRYKEEGERGKTRGARVADITSEIPAYLIEFMAGGPAATAAKTGVKAGVKVAAKAVGKSVKSQALKTTGKVLEKTGEVAVGGAARTATVFAPRVGEQYVERQLEGDESPAMSMLKSFGSVWVDAATEETGVFIGRGVRGFLGHLPKTSEYAKAVRKGIENTWLKLGVGRTKRQFIDNIRTATGWHGMLEELGEEHLARILGGVFNFNNEDLGILSRLQKTAIPDPNELLDQLASFSIIGAGFGLAKVGGSTQRRSKERSILSKMFPELTKPEVKEVQATVESGKKDVEEGKFEEDAELQRVHHDIFSYFGKVKDEAISQEQYDRTLRKKINVHAITWGAANKKSPGALYEHVRFERAPDDFTREQVMTLHQSGGLDTFLRQQAKNFNNVFEFIRKFEKSQWKHTEGTGTRELAELWYDTRRNANLSVGDEETLEQVEAEKDPFYLEAAQKRGLVYHGIQRGPSGEPRLHLFTEDEGRGTTFGVKPGETIDEALSRRQEVFHGKAASLVSKVKKGDITWTKSGEVVVRAFKSADVSTAMHELFHHWETLLPEEDQQQLNEAASRERNTLVGQREFNARAFERWLREGKSPVPELEPAFKEFSGWMKQIYPEITSSPLRVQISPQMKTVFEHLFMSEEMQGLEKLGETLAGLRGDEREAAQLEEEGEEGIPGKVYRLKYPKAHDKHNEPRIFYLGSFIHPTSGNKLVAGINLNKLSRDDRSILREYREELMGIEDPKARWQRGLEVLGISWKDAYRTYKDEEIEEVRRGRLAQADEAEKAFKRRTMVEKFANSLSSVLSFAQRLEARPAGHELTEVGDAIEVTSRLLEANWIAPQFYRMSRMSGEGKNKLEEVENDEARVKRIVEGKEEPSTDEHREYRDEFRRMNQYFIDQAREFTLQSLASIEREEGQANRWPRLFTEQGLDAVEQKNSPEYQQILDAAKKLNPGLSETDIVSRLDSLKGFETSSKTRLGIIDTQENLDLPTHIGKLQILETDPGHVFEKIVRLRARRLAVLKHAGRKLMLERDTQGLLSEVARILDVVPNFDEEVLRSKLERLGWTRDLLDKLPLRSNSSISLSKIAKSLDIPAAVTKSDLLEAINKVGSVSEEQELQLKVLAGKIPGVDLNLSGPPFLESLQAHLGLEYENVFSTLRKDYVSQGGKEEDFSLVETFIRGGAPWKPVGQSLVGKGWRVLSDILGTVQISLAAIPNIYQPLLVIPYVGTGNFARALGSVATPQGYAEARDRGYAVGAYEPIKLSRHPDFGPEGNKITRRIQEVFAKLTTFDFQNQKNNVIAAEAARFLAEDWKTKGLTGFDLTTARDINLTDKEIALIQARQMSEEIRAKIIQKIVAQTQAMTEAKFRQGFLTQHPLVREIFPYQSFSTMQLRRTLKLGENLRDGIDDALKGRGFIKLFKSTQQIASTLVSWGLSGYLGEMTREILTGSKPPPDKDKDGFMSRFLDGLMEAQFLGPITRTVLRGDKYSFDGFDYIGAQMPKLRGIKDIFEFLYNQTVDEDSRLGREGKLGTIDQAKALVRKDFGLGRTVMNWYEKLAYPKQSDYRDVRYKIKVWESEQGKTPSRDDYFLNPKYYYIKQAVIRGDDDEARRLVRQYYKREKNLKSAIQNLHSALNNSRPLNLNPSDTVRFLNTLSDDDRRKVLAINRDYMRRMNILAPKWSTVSPR